MSDRRRVLQHLRAAGRRRCSTGTSTSPGTRRWPGSTRSGDPAAAAAPSPCATPTAIASRTSWRGAAGRCETLADLRGRTLADRRDRLAAGDADPARPAAPRRARARRATSRSGASTCSSASTAITSAASATRFACLKRGEAAACAMLDLNWDGWTKDGTIDADEFAIVGRNRPLRPLRLHRPPGPRRRPPSGAGSTRCSRCATTIPRTAR